MVNLGMILDAFIRSMAISLALLLPIREPGHRTGETFAPGSLFISPTGSDTNDGSIQRPFRSLERAQAALRARGGGTAYVRGGIYPQTAPLRLLEADANETWAAYPGEKPILDGRGHVDDGIFIRAPNITITGLSLRAYLKNGIVARRAHGLFVVNNEIADIRSDEWATGAINIMNSAELVVVDNNSVHDARYAGIIVQNAPEHVRHGIWITNNRVINSCTAVRDCGAIYLDDRSHAGRDQHIIGNLVVGYDNRRSSGNGIYLDDYASGIEVRCNVVIGPGEFALHIHGGDHNLIRQNTFDVRNVRYLLFYQQEPPRWPQFPMDSNTIEENEIINRPASQANIVRRMVGADKQLPVFLRNRFVRTRGPEPAGCKRS